MYRHQGLSENIVSDRNLLFISDFWRALFSSLCTKLSQSSAYRPQSNGQGKITNRKAEEMIRLFIFFDRFNGNEYFLNLLFSISAYSTSGNALQHALTNPSQLCNSSCHSICGTCVGFKSSGQRRSAIFYKNSSKKL